MKLKYCGKMFCASMANIRNEADTQGLGRLIPCEIEIVEMIMAGKIDTEIAGELLSSRAIPEINSSSYAISWG